MPKECTEAYGILLLPCYVSILWYRHGLLQATVEAMGLEFDWRFI